MKRRKLLKGFLASVAATFAGTATGSGYKYPMTTVTGRIGSGGNIQNIPKVANPLMVGVRNFLKLEAQVHDAYVIKEIPIEEHPLFSHFDDNGDPVLHSLPEEFDDASRLPDSIGVSYGSGQPFSAKINEDILRFPTGTELPSGFGMSISRRTDRTPNRQGAGHRRSGDIR